MFLPEPVRARNLFFVKFAVKSGLSLLVKLFPKFAFAFTGPLGWIIGFFAEKFIYLLVDYGILALDLSLMEKNINLEESDYKKAIYEAYIGSKKKILTEDQKRELRNAVIETTRKFVRVKLRKP